MTDDQLVELLDALLLNLNYLPKCHAELIFPSMTHYGLLQNVCRNLRDFHGLKVNGCIESGTIEYVLPQFQLMAETVGHFCFVLLSHELDVPKVNCMLAHLLVKIIPVELEVMHICSTNLKALKSEQVGSFTVQLLKASPDILRKYLILLQAHMVNVITASTSARNIHVMIEFLLIIVTDTLKDIIHHDKLFVLLARVGALTREVSILVRNLEENSRNEENMNETSHSSLDLLESIELLKEDLKYIFLKSPRGSSHMCFPKSDGPLFMALLLKNLHDLHNSNACSVALIKEEIRMVKEGLEFIRFFFGNVEQILNRDLWTRVLDVAYEAEHDIKSILVRDHGLLQLIFLLPNTVEKIKFIKEEVPKKIPKDRGFEEETNRIIRKLTTGPAKIDVISIVGMPGLGKTTLAYKVYNDNSVVEHFDVRAWCIVDQERNEKKLLQKIYNQVFGMKEKFSEDHIDDGVADKLRKRLFGKSDPLYLRLFTQGESWELLEKRVFGEEHCPDELLDVGEKIARKCGGLPLVLDLIGGVIARKEKKKVLWLEVLKNLNSFIFKDEEEVMKVIQLSYDHLSNHLKPCLLYFASYPKDQDIEISELKDLWSAEGFVEQSEMRSVEEVMEVYMDELISSSLVIVLNEKRGRGPSCQIHDLVHDFCSLKARKENLFDFISSRNSFSSSDFCSSLDLMPRGITIQHNEHLVKSDEFCALFNPEKKNPYVKHLLSLKLYTDESECIIFPT
ncbi:putative late blight resistance protein homolog R1C-3 [Nicotiana tabacum]|uniref:Late blight resistance protein homolog R1C-3 n=1 Tax=Nicotiana tabacum TaxID=4097 RepID=A0AC58SIE7_TOBAC